MSNSHSKAHSPLRLAMLGMIEGNGHPYSWSAIVNGYNPVAMAKCPYPAIPQYMNAEAAGTVGFADAQVTHLWTDQPLEAESVAAAALIPEIVSHPEDVIGHVDAVLIATDDGYDHVRRVRKFIEAGLPVFIDKPLALSLEDLQEFINWHKQGARFLSSSGMRYAPEIEPFLTPNHGLGNLRWIAGVTCKTWERYGIHLVEPLFRILGPGFHSVRLESAPGIEVAHLLHRTGVQASIPVIYDGGAVFGTIQLCGTKGQTTVRLANTYAAFRAQLRSFVDFVHSGAAPYPFAETVEMMAVLIAGIRSRAEKSRHVEISEILSSLS